MAHKLWTNGCITPGISDGRICLANISTVAAELSHIKLKPPGKVAWWAQWLSVEEVFS